ncbi:hypothetical protein E5K00_00490 [Hymenobacter aquaticus]|uniref:Uncharacterized protein n=1 Tax=Hymenobacter aquaticus TaxID=1867101 RepID=A0A4Z0Q214_9BACT|nr:hypothetical protein [Hymenobacter aquaticus]TGE23725.1 hypothetical protein E5K00_00490 [Hymenobacter aquaticus]
MLPPAACAQAPAGAPGHKFIGRELFSNSIPLEIYASRPGQARGGSRPPPEEKLVAYRQKPTVRMGFWSFLFGKPLRLEDQVFGRLRYFDTPESGGGYWEGETRFTAARYEVGLAIDGPKTGPTAAQRSFYQEIEARYEQMVPAIAQLITATFTKSEPDFVIRDFKQEFQPDFLSLPVIEKPDTAEPAWEIAFETTHAKIRMASVYVEMRGFQPYYVYLMA